MANPKRRHSNTRSRLRRAHDFLKVENLKECPQCHKACQSHRVCPSCGYYKGRQVMTVKVRAPKKKKK